MTLPENVLHQFATLVNDQTCNKPFGRLKVGVDLGTANIVLSVVDEKNQPVAGITYPSTIVKDGIVVDYPKASRIVTDLKEQLEKKLQQPLIYAATAIPPGISIGNAKVIANVVESAGFIVTNVVDEPVAAATVLDIKNGAVVDVGGGTTGMALFRNKQIILSVDEPTGGTHMTLVLAGALGISVQEAELYKKNDAHADEVFTIIKPVIEKMAVLVKNWLTPYKTKNIYLVGGASCIRNFSTVFRDQTQRNIICAPEPLFVTPLGIALNVRLPES